MEWKNTSELHHNCQTTSNSSAVISTTHSLQISTSMVKAKWGHCSPLGLIQSERQHKSGFVSPPWLAHRVMDATYGMYATAVCQQKHIAFDWDGNSNNIMPKEISDWVTSSTQDKFSVQFYQKQDLSNLTHAFFLSSWKQPVLNARPHPDTRTLCQWHILYSQTRGASTKWLLNVHAEAGWTSYWRIRICA